MPPTINGQWEIIHPDAGVLLLGTGTPYPIAGITGLGVPDVKAEDLEVTFTTPDGLVAYPPGIERLTPREVILEIGIDAEADTTDYFDLVQDLIAAWTPGQSSPDVIYRFMRFGRVHQFTGRPRGLALPWDDDFFMGAAHAQGRIVAHNPTIQVL
jgi:hypothetical protein